jgi:hypothetical protein
MAFGELGAQALRAENVDKVVKGFALQEYIVKPLFTVQSSGAWQESYYTESANELTADNKIARLAAFPQQSPQWQKSSAYMQKHGLEVDVSFEDEKADNVDVIQRSLLRLARAVSYSVDSLCYTTMSAGAGQTHTIGGSNPNDLCWDTSTRSERHPLDAIGSAIKKVKQQNYRPDHIILNPNDYNLLLTNDDILDAVSWTNNVVQGGSLPSVLGLTILASNAVTADQALVFESKVFGTYREILPMTTNTEKHEFIKTVIRAAEVGVPFVTDPMAVCKIANTNQ